MSKQVSKEEEFILKFNILKKTLIEERKKNSLLQSEINNLKDDLIIQKQIIIQFQEKEGKGKVIEEPLKKLFDESGQAKELTKTKDQQIAILTKEKELVKEQISLLEKEKECLDNMISDMLKQYSQLKESSDIQINDLHKHYENLTQSHIEDTKRLESMSSLISKYEMEKNELEKENDLLLKALNKKEEGYENLFEEQTILNEEIGRFKQQIDELQIENKQLKEFIEEISPITINTVFKGVRIISKHPLKTSNISMTFGEIEKSLVIREENENGKVFKLKFINNMVKIEPNMIRFNLKIEETEQVFFIQFEKKHINHILKFYVEGTLKKKFVENMLISYSLDNYPV